MGKVLQKCIGQLDVEQRYFLVRYTLPQILEILGVCPGILHISTLQCMLGGVVRGCDAAQQQKEQQQLRPFTHLKQMGKLLQCKKQMNKQSRVEKKSDLTIVYPKIHKHTFLWIHGMGEPQDKYIKKIINALGTHADYFKIILPKAPNRFVTFLGAELSSWFDVYFRGEMRFKVPFEEAFSLKQINQSYERILLPLIEEQSALVKSVGGKLIVSGFSQGCGMSIHCLYTKPELVDAAIGVSGYFFPTTKYDPKLNDRLHLIYGKQDYLSEWDHTKISYYGRIAQKKVNFIEGMGHEVNKDTQKAIGQAVNSILGHNPKL